MRKKACLVDVFRTRSVCLLLATPFHADRNSDPGPRRAKGSKNPNPATPKSPTSRRFEKNPQANLRFAGALAGDTVEVLPSDRFPVDGVILDGRTAADESSLTGVCVCVRARACVRQIDLRPDLVPCD